MFSTLIMDLLMIKVASLVYFTLFTILFSVNVNSSTLLIVGDSLSAGYQLPIAKNWVTLLPAQLQQQGKQVSVINASISGDTTGNGLARLPGLLAQHQPDYVLIELGANDGLRGFMPSIISANLSKMISHITAQQAVPLLMQINVPTNYGKRYSNAFTSLYPTLSKQHDIALLPFYLEEVFSKPNWMQSDGLHPNADAQPWIAQFMAKQLSKVIN